MCEFLATGSEPRHRCRRGHHGPGVGAGPTCELTPLFVRAAWRRRHFRSNTTPQLNKSEGQTVSMRNRIAIGPNRQASLQAQNYNAGSRCRSMATSREFTGENAVQCISMCVCNTLLSADPDDEACRHGSFAYVSFGWPRAIG